MSGAIAAIAGAGVPSTLTGGTTFWNGWNVTTNSTYSFVVPDGITQITALCIGGGGGGGGNGIANNNTRGAGGGGGSLSYFNDLAVTPGETLTVVVGRGGPGGTAASSAPGNGTAGGTSSVARGATTLVAANGGGGGAFATFNVSDQTSGGGGGGSGPTIASQINYAGGNGGVRGGFTAGGGGGAGGYAGVGGNGASQASGSAQPSGSGAGGAGAGGGNNSTGIAGNGGGTLFYGQGANGASVSGSTGQTGFIGSPIGAATQLFAASQYGPGGGGGGSGQSAVGPGQAGAAGLVRLLWNGSPAFPSTNVQTNELSIFATAGFSAGTFTIPSGVLPGDLILVLEIALNSSGVPSTPTLPANWERIINSTGTNYRINVLVKTVLSAAEGGTTITSLDGNNYDGKVLYVIRGARGVRRNAAVTQSNVSSLATGAQTVTATASTSGVYTTGMPIQMSMFYNALPWVPGTNAWLLADGVQQSTTQASYVPDTLGRLFGAVRIYPSGNAGPTTSTGTQVLNNTNPGLILSSIIYVF